jgi:hypothetical protein
LTLRRRAHLGQGATASPYRRPCESRDPYAVPSRSAAASGSRLYGRDDRNMCIQWRVRGVER